MHLNMYLGKQGGTYRASERNPFEIWRILVEAAIAAQRTYGPQVLRVVHSESDKH